MPTFHKELQETVLRMKDKKAPGSDSIPSKVLKLVCKAALATQRIQSIFESGYFSFPLEAGEVYPYKQGQSRPRGAISIPLLDIFNAARQLFENLTKPKLTEAMQHETAYRNITVSERGHPQLMRLRKWPKQ